MWINLTQPISFPSHAIRLLRRVECVRANRMWVCGAIPMWCTVTNIMHQDTCTLTSTNIQSNHKYIESQWKQRVSSSQYTAVGNCVRLYGCQNARTAVHWIFVVVEIQAFMCAEVRSYSRIIILCIHWHSTHERHINKFIIVWQNSVWKINQLVKLRKPFKFSISSTPNWLLL